MPHLREFHSAGKVLELTMLVKVTKVHTEKIQDNFKRFCDRDLNLYFSISGLFANHYTSVVGRAVEYVEILPGDWGSSGFESSCQHSLLSVTFQQLLFCKGLQKRHIDLY